LTPIAPDASIGASEALTAGAQHTEQRRKLRTAKTTEQQKNEKSMKKTLVTSVALAACVTTQLFAQNAKEDTITMSLTVQGQNSVSTSATKANYGTWATGPAFYKTTSTKLTQTDVLRAISYVMHGGNANYYSASAKLVMVQAELGGFFNIGTNLPGAMPVTTNVVNNGHYDQATFSTSVASGTVEQLTIPKLASGRHFEPNPTIAATDAKETSSWPVGHHQPWGQIFVKDTAKGLCENVTFFFNVTVQECYDCFYMNSFISDASFKFNSSTTIDGPPCCVSVKSSITGLGKDRYYMTLSFDNTDNNPYLNEATGGVYYTGYAGIARDTIPGDGVTPDAIDYVDIIASGVGKAQPYAQRWTLNGIVTYTWNLKLVNSSDAAPDYVGTAAYAVNGYGFIALRCSLLTGSATITEKIVKTSTCCLDLPWYNSWYGFGQAFDATPSLPRFGASYPDADVDPLTPVNDPADLSTHVNYNQQAPRNTTSTP